MVNVQYIEDELTLVIKRKIKRKLHEFTKYSKSVLINKIIKKDISDNKHEISISKF